jgi:thioredoxin 1
VDIAPIIARNSAAPTPVDVTVSDLKTFETDTFAADVLQAGEPVLIDFWAEWCGPCRMIAPVVDEIAEQYAGKLTVGKLDVDQNPEIAMQYGVMGIPTLGLFHGGKLVDRLVGYPGPGGVKGWIARALEAQSAA